MFEFPAATAVTIPSETRPCTAVSRAQEAPPPRERLATAGSPEVCWVSTQSMAATIVLVEVLPVQPNTRTGTRVVPSATP